MSQENQLGNPADEQKNVVAGKSSLPKMSPSEDWRRFVTLADRKDDAGETAASQAANRVFGLHVRNLLAQPTLDVDVVSHCNLNCACCCHFAPIAKPRFLSLDEYAKDLELIARINGLQEFYNAICLMGGEPLLHPNISEVVRITREYLSQITIRLVTNGLLLDSMPLTFWHTMSQTEAQILMTPYPVGLDYNHLKELAESFGISAAIGGGLAVGDNGELYFLRTPMDETGSQNPLDAFSACPLGGSTMQLYNGRIYPCNRGALFETLNERFGTDFQHQKGDYLDLVSLKDAAEIDSFRRTPKPMCRYCASTAAERVAWENSRLSKHEWIQLSN